MFTGLSPRRGGCDRYAVAMDVERLISQRSRSIDASGIRKVFDLGAKLKDPINLSIGQPDFPVPESVKRAAIEAINSNQNGYTVTQGIAPLRKRIAEHLHHDLGWLANTGEPGSGIGTLVTAGTSGGLYLMMMSLLDPGSEIIIPDPYFVAYPHMATVTGAKAVRCDTYPDFKMTAERIEPLITPKTRAVLLNSPGNPTGVVLTTRECRDVLELCRKRGVLLVSDEIYDEFCFPDARESSSAGMRCPSPARNAGAHEDVLLIRGFGKTYACTGWRMGYVAGPEALVREMMKLQQYTYVCAPSPLQWGCMATFDVDMTESIALYQRRRDRVVERLSKVTEVFTPGGAFYCFVKVPPKLGMTGQQFCEKAIERSLLVIPGGVFSDRDTHFRLSFATKEENLERGLDVLVALMS